MMTTYPSEKIRNAARRLLMDKRRRGVRPLAVTVREISQACPGIPKDDIANELAALACADGCRLSSTIQKELMLLWEL